MAAIALAVGGCAGSKYEPPRDRLNSIDTGGQVFGPDEEWKEAQFSLPPYPRESSLLPFEISGPSYNLHYLDPQSISVGTDGVVRYTLVVKTSSNVENVSFEGIRCEEAQWKAYAFGRQGQWVPARDAQWRKVAYQSLEGYRHALFRTYFCPDGLPRRSAQEIVASVKRQYQAGPLQKHR
jgi:hypothetical protein